MLEPTLIEAPENLALGGKQVAVWDARSFQLVSLLEMLQVYANQYLAIGNLLGILDTKLRDTWFPHALLSDQDCAQVQGYIQSIKVGCANIHLASSVALCDLLSQRYSQNVPSRTQLKDDLELLAKSITGELQSRVFLYMPPPDAALFTQPTPLFGDEVALNFPSTQEDIREAGRCFALERYTACVFHSMRVLEKGLHALVHELNNSFQTNIVFNKQVEFVNWGTIIDKIESEIRELLKPTRQPRLTQSDVQFYSEAAKEFVYFKGAWRDDVSHSRGTYDRTDAGRVLQHVKAFMMQIATKLKE